MGKTNESLTTTTPKPQMDLGKFGVVSSDQTVRAIGSQSQLSRSKKIIDDIEEITEKYTPFSPNIRPWLVIIEVNMTDEARNTECTG